MAKDMTNKMTKDMPIDGNTPLRYCTSNGMTISTNGEAPKEATTAILYLGGGTTTVCPGRVNHVSVPVSLSS